MTKAIARIGGFDNHDPTNWTVAGAGQTLLRVAAGALFLPHGLQKLFGLLGGFMGTDAPAQLLSPMGFAGALEVGGGLLLIAGFLTRPVAIVLALQMIAAYFIAHSPQGGFPIQNGGELALLYAVTFAFFAANGAGPVSVDRWISRRWNSATVRHGGVTVAPAEDGRERWTHAA